MRYQSSIIEFGLPVLLLLPLAGCSTSSWVNGDDVATSDMDATITVSAGSSSETEVRAYAQDISVTSNDVYVDLGDEYFRASAAGDVADLDFNGDLFDQVGDLSSDVKRLEPEGSWSLYGRQYTARFKGDYAGRTFTVGLVRSGNRKDAPASIVTMPAAFAITSPGSGTTFSHASDSITIAWDPAGDADPMSLLVYGACVNSVDVSYRVDISTDPGIYTLPPNFLASAYPGLTASCNMTIKLSRSRRGVLDTAYNSGIIVAEQVRVVRFNLVP